MNIKDKIKKNDQKIYYASVYLILKYAVAMQLIQYNPANDVIVPRKRQKEKAGVKYLDNK
ncbi:hypothetical protein ABID28_001385 [Streptococcus porcorum]|uniref:Integrase n=1 Tax=Streptococcus porcorum TaxID=701526 RepID=A0ABV2JJ13_9STRE